MSKIVECEVAFSVEKKQGDGSITDGMAIA